MKRLVFYFLLLFLPATAFAQGLVKAEYFIDTDPGVGNGAPVLLAGGSDSVTFSASVNLGGLPEGVHYLAMRMQQADGHWGLSEVRQFFVAPIVVPVNRPPIVAMEYFIDADPGIGQGTLIALAQGSDSVNLVASIPANIPEGFHYLGIRMKDAEGKWGFFEARSFIVANAPAPINSAPIVAAEYFIDTDPGVGQGIPISIGSGGDSISFIASIPANIPEGFHYLGIRMKDAEGKWGFFEARSFIVANAPAPINSAPVVAAEYFIDTDPGVGLGTPLNIGSSGDSVNFVAAIPANIPEGFHYLGIRMKDAEGKWGFFEARSFIVAPSPSAINSPPIVAAEYFIDTDPGVGQGTPLNIGSSGDSVSFIATLPVNLAPGFHYLGIRMQDATGKWGPFEVRSFIVSPPNNTTNSPQIVAAEYFFNNDPGPGNANPLPVPSGDSVAIITTIPTPCLGTGQHYLGIRFKDHAGNWGHFLHDTITITSGISAAIVTPAGPVTFCAGDSAVLSSALLAGVTYEWLKDGNPIPGASSNVLVVTAAGNYSLKTTCGGSFTTSNVVNVTISASVSPGTVTVSPTLCINQNTTATSTGILGGTWSSSDTSVAIVQPSTGIVTAIGPGTTYITYTLNSGCGSPVSASDTLIIDALPSAGAISGAQLFCVGQSDTLITDGQSGGVWSSNHPSVITIGSLSGIATAVGGGTATITYSIATNCGPVISTYQVTVNPKAEAGTIVGTASLCIGATAIFTSNGDTGGIWLSSTPTVIQINTQNGSATAQASGSAVIEYIVTNTCNAADTARLSITVNPDVSAGILTGVTTLCIGQTETIQATGVTGGTWNTDNPSVASVSTNGAVTGVSGGTAILTYTVTSGCNAPASAQISITVIGSNFANAGSIIGNASSCIGDVTPYSSNGTQGGTWASSNTAVLTIDPVSGSATALSPGTTLLTYSVSGCNGTVITTRSVVVNTNATAGTISGLTQACSGSSVLFSTNGTGGGTWSSSNPQVASVNSSGFVNALAAGTATINYTVAGCGGTFSNSRPISVFTPVNAGTISGPAVVCINQSIFFTSNGTTGGRWSTADTLTMAVDSSTGQVTALAAGTATLRYTVSGCNGIRTATRVLTITNNPTAGTVTGPGSLCIGKTENFGSTGTPSGTWSSSDTTVASINSSTGQLMPLAIGSTIITYSVTACGQTVTSTKTISVILQADAGVVTGVNRVCIVDTTTFLSSGTSGGQWSSSDTLVGSIDPATGVFTAAGIGFTTITYSISGCNGLSSSIRLVEVYGTPSPGITSGPNPICIGTVTTLSNNGTVGGTWSSTNPAVVSVNAQTGEIAGLSNGNAQIVYSVQGCGGTFTSLKNIQVAGNIPQFDFSGSVNFIDQVVFPQEGNPATTFRFEARYININGVFPAPGSPRLIIDYNNDGIFNGPFDKNLQMFEMDASDQDVTDGKKYFITVRALALDTNYVAYFSAQTPTGCSTISSAFEGPDVTTNTNLFLYANDITFSSSNPPVSSPLTVTVVIHNDTAVEANNFFVSLFNQYDSLTVYPKIFVPRLPAYSDTVLTWVITTPAVPAWVPIQIVIDEDDEVPENNEFDNQAIRPFTNGNFNVPGSILLTTPNNQTVCASSAISICGTAVYQGTAIPLQNPGVAGATVTAEILELQQQLQVYTNSNGGFCISFISPVIVGSYTLAISITDFTLESRDTVVFSTLFCPPPPPVLGPDLVVEIFTPNEVFAGSPINGTFRIRNVGNLPSPASIARVYVGSQGPSTGLNVSIPALNPNDFVDNTYSVVSPLAKGNELICAYADADQQVQELNEGNNESCSWTRICPVLPDLTCDLPRSIITNKPFPNYMCDSITFIVSNRSCVPANTPFVFTAQAFLNGSFVTSSARLIDSLPRGANTSVTFYNYFPGPGNYEMRMSVDVGNAVPEDDEGNNTTIEMQQVFECLPELSIGAGCGSATPADPQIPGTITMNTVIRNTGRLGANPPILVELQSQGVLYTDTITVPIPPGGSIPVSIDFPTPPFTCPDVVFAVDPDNRVREYAEDNSASYDLSFDYMVTEVPSLCIEEDEPNPNFWQVPQIFGEPTQMIIGFKSFSGYLASQVKVRFEVTGPLINGWLDLGYGTIDNVACINGYCPARIALSNLFTFPSIGVYQVRMTADGDNRYIECNENNNDTIVDVTVTVLPDYRIISQYIAPSLLNPDRGQGVTITVSYQNTGTDDTNDSLSLRVRVDNLTHQTLKVPGLLSGTIGTVQCSNQWSSMLPGLHVIRATIDVLNQIPEANELNNSATRGVIVGKAANLYFQVFTADNLFPPISQNINIQGRIGNSGDLDCNATISLYYLDDQNDSIVIGTFPITVLGRDSTTFTFPWTVLDNTTTIVGKIENPSVIQVQEDNKTASFQLQDFSVVLTSTPSCYFSNDGRLTPVIAGGTPPYSYLWSNGDTSDVLNGFPGIYTVTVTDSRGSERSLSGRIFAGPPRTFYEDADGDNFGNPNSIEEECNASPGYVSDYRDCNDFNPGVNPIATEVCNLIDDDCDGLIDEGVQQSFFRDEDADNYGNILMTLEACTAPSGYVTDSSDCNDALPAINPAATEVCNGLDDDCDSQIDEGVNFSFYLDNDQDGYGNRNVLTLDCSPPPGYVSDSSDCNDYIAAIHPGATEICNLLDDNCNGIVDEGFSTTYYRDQDGDTYGNALDSTNACSQPAGYTSDSSDCNDGNGLIHPGIVDLCNGIDDNCNGIIDEDVATTYFRDFDADGFGDQNSRLSSCSPLSGFVNDSTDCDDFVAAINPAATENCNGIDDNCNGLTDEGFTAVLYRDADGDTFGDPQDSLNTCNTTQGYVNNRLDCNDNDNNIHPGGTEFCNGIDENCNSLIDDGLLTIFYLDADGDGYGNPNITKDTCSTPTRFVANNLDCSDSDPDIYPGALEICNGLDDDCDGQIDEGVLLTFHADQDGDGFGDKDHPLTACFAPPGNVVNSTDCNDNNDLINPGMTEVCNGIDDDCDLQIDEGLLQTLYRDLDGDGYGDLSSTLQACTPPNGYTSNSTDCNDLNAAINPGATEICNGFDDDCDGTIDEGCNSCNITLNMGNDVATYFGYSLNETVLRTIIPSGGTPPYTFKWSLNRPLICNHANSSGDEEFIIQGATCNQSTCPPSGTLTTAPICTNTGTSSKISATLLDSATVCLTVTDSRGCTASGCFRIRALDARCSNAGKNNHKVWICHRTSSRTNPWVQICVASSAVPAHLAHGDYVGPCQNPLTIRSSEEPLMETHDLLVYPNPADGQLFIEFISEIESNGILTLISSTGQTLLNKPYEIRTGLNLIELNTGSYPSGFYLLNLNDGTNRKSVKLILK